MRPAGSRLSGLADEPDGPLVPRYPSAKSIAVTEVDGGEERALGGGERALGGGEERGGSTANVVVCVRVRPLLAHEGAGGGR